MSAAEAAIPSVRDGVFFTKPPVLPRGNGALPREEVLAAQRERLMASVTELMAVKGFANVTLTEIAKRAKVSTSAFYDCFPDKESCAFAAYDRFIQTLLQALAARAQDLPDFGRVIDGLLGGYLETLQQDLVVARAFQVEMDALGPSARERRRDALMLIARFLKERHEHFREVDAELVPVFDDAVYLSIVYGARQLACDALDSAVEPDLTEVARRLAPWLHSSLRPAVRA